MKYGQLIAFDTDLFIRFLMHPKQRTCNLTKEFETFHKIFNATQTENLQLNRTSDPPQRKFS